MNDEPYRTTGTHTTEDKSRTKLQQEGWPKLKGTVLLRPKSQLSKCTGGEAITVPYKRQKLVADLTISVKEMDVEELEEGEVEEGAEEEKTVEEEKEEEETVKEEEEEGEELLGLAYKYVAKSTGVPEKEVQKVIERFVAFEIAKASKTGSHTLKMHYELDRKTSESKVAKEKNQTD